MSRAFDTIDRRRLLTVMGNIVGPDEMRMLRLLLLDASLVVRVGRATSKSFSNTTGTPQGDGLSPVLFTCYLAAALKDTKHRLPTRPQADAHIPHDTEYADDVNFYSTSQEWLQKSLPIIAETLQAWSLKTEWVTVSATDEDWRSVKQLGSLMGTPEDMKRRMQQAAIAFRRMYALWLRKDHVSIDRRVRLYKVFVLPALLYNCCTWGATKACMDRLDAFHRRQLRSLLGIRYPARISNAALYKKCHSSPISETISRRRLTMLGYTLRPTEDTPPSKQCDYIFTLLPLPSQVVHKQRWWQNFSEIAVQDTSNLRPMNTYQASSSRARTETRGDHL